MIHQENITNSLVPGKNYPLSSGQKGMWLLHQLQPYSDRYNMPLTFRFSNEISIENLKRVIEVFIQRHSLLRSTFHQLDGEPVRRVCEKVNYEFFEQKVEDCTSEGIIKLVRVLSGKPFDLEVGPLVRAFVLSGHLDKRILLINFHHLIFDGASLNLMVKEFEEIYKIIFKNQDPVKGQVVEYQEFVNWQTSWLNSEEADESRQYWTEALKQVDPVLALPYKNGIQSESIHGEIIKFEIPKNTRNAFSTLAKSAQCSEYFAWFLAYSVFLAKLTQSNQLLIGTPSRGRPDSMFDQVIGYFVNMVPVKISVNQQLSFVELLKHSKGDLFETLFNADLPVAEIVSLIDKKNSRGEEPLFQTSFVWSFLPDIENPLDSFLQLELLPLVHESGEQEFSLEMLVSKESTFGIIKYRRDSFESVVIENIQQSFVSFIDELALGFDQHISTIPLLNKRQKDYLAKDLNYRGDAKFKQQCIHHIFEHQVATTPDACALSFCAKETTFQALNARANQVANYLVEQGVKPKAIVGLCTDRSVEMIVGLLGILKAGAAYLPLDVSLPRERLDFLLTDSKVQLVLTQDKLQARFNSQVVQVLALDNSVFENVLHQYPIYNLPNVTVDVSFPAYAMYTSGSTGQPKGVLQTHLTISNLVQAQKLNSGLCDNLKTLQFAPFTFDVSLQEMVTAWFCGSELVLMQQSEKDELNQFVSWLGQRKIQRVFLPPAVLNWLAEDCIKNQKSLTELREVIVAGEALQISSYLEQFLTAQPKCQLWNHYGPSETHVATIALVNNYSSHHIQPIGKVLNGMSAYVLNENFELVPYGVVGELFLGGAGLALGYVNRAELTQQKFVDNPIKESLYSILYRTGDLVRYSNEGELLFIGRSDNQVKIRGFRIELGEIEFQLSELLEVNSSTVIVEQQNSDNKRLVAYFTSDSLLSDKTLLASIKSRLKLVLPDYMLPSIFVRLQKIPLNANGKVDKKALPPIEHCLIQDDYLAPESEVDVALCTICSELLNIPMKDISINANFFEIGGHSLLVVKLINEIKHRLQVELGYKQFFSYPNLSDISEHITSAIKKSELTSSLASISDSTIEELEW